MTAQICPSHSLTEKFFKKLKALKENNNHGEAYEEAARVLGLKEIERELHRINLIHNRVGHLTVDLNQKRYRKYVELLQNARPMLSKGDYDKLYSCF